MQPGHILGPNEPIPTKFGLWMFFIMLHRYMVSKTLKCKKVFVTSSLLYSIASMNISEQIWIKNKKKKKIVVSPMWVGTHAWLRVTHGIFSAFVTDCRGQQKFSCDREWIGTNLMWAGCERDRIYTPSPV